MHLSLTFAEVLIRAQVWWEISYPSLTRYARGRSPNTGSQVPDLFASYGSSSWRPSCVCLPLGFQNELLQHTYYMHAFSDSLIHTVIHVHFIYLQHAVDCTWFMCRDYQRGTYLQSVRLFRLGPGHFFMPLSFAGHGCCMNVWSNAKRVAPASASICFEFNSLLGRGGWRWPPQSSNR
jgi:hypothetical protein